MSGVAVGNTCFCNHEDMPNCDSYMWLKEKLTEADSFTTWWAHPAGTATISPAYYFWTRRDFSGRPNSFSWYRFLNHELLHCLQWDMPNLCDCSMVKSLPVSIVFHANRLHFKRAGVFPFRFYKNNHESKMRHRSFYSCMGRVISWRKECLSFMALGWLNVQKDFTLYTIPDVRYRGVVDHVQVSTMPTCQQ